MGKAFPNPYSQHKSVGQQGTPSGRGLVVNVMDPFKAGRVQIRIHGHHDDEINIPDTKLPWVKLKGSTSTGSMQTYTGTHGLIPGAEVYVDITGQSEQDFVITGSIPNDRKDDQQSIHPATQGKDATDTIWGKDKRSTAKKGDGSHGWHKDLKSVVESKTTREARETRDKAGRKTKRSQEPIKEARDSMPVPSHYGERGTSKDPKGGSIGVFKFPGAQDSQKFIQDTIKNASAVVPNALDAINQLKKVAANPTSIESIGAGNFSSILSQLASLFGGKGGGGSSSSQPMPIFDCEHLKKMEDNQLTEEQLLEKRRCILIDELKQQEQVTS